MDQTIEAYVDEITPIAQYMAEEMQKNAGSEAVRLMHHLNHYPQRVCDQALQYATAWRQIQQLACKTRSINEQANAKVSAMAIWAFKVGPRQEWDHKPKILAKFPPKVEYDGSHQYGDRLYYHDIWSNIHYGYVGRHAGFSESMLLEGAGAAQFASDVVTQRKIPSRQAPVTGGPADYDPPRDRESIKLGMSLKGATPDADALVEAIVKYGIAYIPVPSK